MTIILPEWFVWFLVVWCMLHTCVAVADLILHRFQRKLAQLRDAMNPQRQVNEPDSARPE